MLKNIPFYASLLEQTLIDGTKPKTGMILVYGAIEVHSFGERGCIASNKTIGDECGLKESSVASYISILAKNHWIKVTLDKNNHRTSIDPLIVVKPPFDYSKTPLLLQSNIEYSNKNTVIDKEIYKEKIPTKEKQLLELVNRKLKRKFRILPRGIKKTLDNFSIDEISRSLDIMLLDNWHRDKIGDLKLDYILRASTIDSMLTRKSMSKIGTTKPISINTDDFKNEDIVPRTRVNTDNSNYKEYVKKKKYLFGIK